MLTQSVANEYLNLARTNALYTQLYNVFSTGFNVPQKELLVLTQLEVWSNDPSDATKNITQHMATVSAPRDFTAQIIAFEDECKALQSDKLAVEKLQ